MATIDPSVEVASFCATVCGVDIAKHTCTIRGGQYFEEITLSCMRITFRAYPGEKVVLRGTFGPISGPWFSYTDKIYRTPLGYIIMAALY